MEGHLAPVPADVRDRDLKGERRVVAIVRDGFRVYSELEDAGEELYWESVNGRHVVDTGQAERILHGVLVAEADRGRGRGEEGEEESWLGNRQTGSVRERRSGGEDPHLGLVLSWREH